MDLVLTDFGLAVRRSLHPDLPLRYFPCVGRNYADHAAELGNKTEERPLVFTKSPMCAIRDGEEIVIPKACQDREQVDFEGELAVILGEPCRDVPEKDALSKVLGYCCANDVSARWWQKEGSGGQFIRGKSFDTFCPLGPRVTPARDVPDPQSLTLITRVSGEEMQRTSTSLMLFPVAFLIAELSRGATLPAGTVLLTGTPAGVGAGRKPPRFLREGDVVEVEISGLGTLRNRVRLER